MTRFFLLVDDDIDDFNLLNDALAATDPSVCLFQIANENELYSWFRENPAPMPELMLLDIYDVGGFNGWEILKRLKEQDAFRDIPVIIYTVDPSFESKRLAGSQALGMIKKPNTLAGMRTLARLLATTKRSDWEKAVREFSVFSGI